jgi:hypothetical protein
VLLWTGFILAGATKKQDYSISSLSLLGFGCLACLTWHYWILRLAATARATPVELVAFFVEDCGSIYANYLS